MAFRKKDDDQGDNFTPRPKVQGNWKCSECGTEITELPFEPTGDRPIYCSDCWKKQRDARPKRDFTPRPKVQGNWKCSECGTEITELPFTPKEDQPIFCFDCWKKQRDAKFQK